LPGPEAVRASIGQKPASITDAPRGMNHDGPLSGMNCTTTDQNRLMDRPSRWSWFEVGSVLLYGTVLGASIVMALADLGVGG